MIFWWAGTDSNRRRQMPAGLQPAPFDRFGTDPFGNYALRQAQDIRLVFCRVVEDHERGFAKAESNGAVGQD